LTFLCFQVHLLFMRAMVLEKVRHPLALKNLPSPRPGAYELLVRVTACAVCRTDLHIVDGELPLPALPLVPGHEIVGTVVGMGRDCAGFQEGDRVGIPWLGSTCTDCEHCLTGYENLCTHAKFTGYTLPGGYAELTTADHRFCFHMPESYSDAEAAPLLCAGLIGHRCLVKAGHAARLGIYGFGAAAHIITQVAIVQGREVYAFTRPGHSEAQEFARKLGAVWAGDSTAAPPKPIQAAIIFAPVGGLVPIALSHLERGGTVVCGGIHMSDIPSFPYELLWQERTICSVANLTRRDARDFLALAPGIPVRTAIQRFPLQDANQALDALRSGKVRGAAVLTP
jgi:propanol-preferring alcohol dehydrogenase